PIQERDLKVTIEMALYVSKVDGERTKAEKRFKTIFEEAPLGVALIDSLTGHIYEVNPKFAEIAGRTREEIEIIDWMSITHPDDVQEDLDNMARLNAGEISGFSMNKRYMHPDGSFVWINMTIAPVTSVDKSKPRHLCMIEDITERKQMEKAIRDSEEKHRTLFETMSQGVVYQNSDGGIIDANPAAEQLLGLSLDQMQGRTSMDPRWNAVHEDGSDFPGETHPGMIALKTGMKVNNVVMGVFHPQKEEHRWININAVPKFREGESTPYENYATFDDITDLIIGKK
ncbi:MAG: PAS domain S-box protein, partial [Deltaproteobacteria bacterium]|nr:PAS domain S-box protein [Deltaproteobacteria bacterium]